MLEDELARQLDEQIRAVRRSFLDGLAGRIDGLDEALNAEGAIEGEPALEVLRRRLHTLRGAAATLELDDVAEATGAIEDEVVAVDAIDAAIRARLSANVAALRTIADRARAQR